MLEGNDTDVNPEQALNAEAPICVTLYVFSLVELVAVLGISMAPEYEL